VVLHLFLPRGLLTDGLALNSFCFPLNSSNPPGSLSDSVIPLKLPNPSKSLLFSISTSNHSSSSFHLKLSLLLPPLLPPFPSHHHYHVSRITFLYHSNLSRIPYHLCHFLTSTLLCHLSFPLPLSLLTSIAYLLYHFNPSLSPFLSLTSIASHLYRLSPLSLQRIFPFLFISSTAYQPKLTLTLII
jgi:hypothetical protein